MQTQFSINARGCALDTIQNGPNKGDKFLKLSVLEKGMHDARTVNVFNKPWIDEMNDADARGTDPDFSQLIGNNVFDKESVSLGGTYWHYRLENGQKIYDQLPDGTRRTYTQMNVLVLYHTQKDIVYDENDVPRFVPGVFDPETHEPVYIKATVRETVVLPDGSTIKRDKRFYAEGFSPEERRDAALRMYYEKATTQNQQVQAQAQVQPSISGDPNVQTGAIVDPV